jgi:hypothetical protein
MDMRLFLIGALIAATGLIAAPRAQGGVDGNWALTFETPMGSMEGSATFKSEGEALTGTVESQAGSTPVKGSVKGKAINFVLNVTTPQGDLAITMTAEVDGDALKGTWDLAGQGTGSWTGKRVK